MPPTVEELRRVSFLADLPDETVERVARWFEERQAEPGDNLTPEGASGYTFFVILDGTATVPRRQDGRYARARRLLRRRRARR